jgi:hypothetical protein
MAYIPNAEDAFEVYMLAMTYLDDIPLNAFAPYHLMNVKELLIKGEFLIWPKEELDNQGRYVEPLAAWYIRRVLGGMVGRVNQRRNVCRA